MSRPPLDPTVRHLVTALLFAALPLIGGPAVSALRPVPPAAAMALQVPVAAPPAGPVSRAVTGPSAETRSPPRVTAVPPALVAPPRAWRWPLLPAPRVLRGFDQPAQPWLAGHRGVDLAAFPGQPVLSASSGVVVFAGQLAGQGVVSVEHGGIRSSYEPVVPLVEPGDPVLIGQPIALVAPLPRHCGVPTCLHWGAFVSLSFPRRYLDPRLLVGAGPVRLVPAG